MTKFTPINPDDAGDLTLFVDSADNRLKFKGHTGDVREIDMSRVEPVPIPVPVPTPTASGVALNILDHTDSGKDIYLAIIGYQGDQWPTSIDSVFSYMNADGSVSVCASGQTFEDFSFKLNDMASGVTLPYFSSGRITISFDKKITSPAISTGSQIINPSVLNPNDLNYYTIWGMMEFSNQLEPPTDTTVCNIDTTLVDGFTFPIGLTLVGGTFGVQTAGAMTASRDDLVAAFEKLPKAFTDQILYDASGNFIRISSPALGVTGGVVPFPADYLDDYITSTWNHYASGTGNVLTFEIPLTVSIPVSGTVNAENVFEFTDANGETYNIPKPSTSDVLGCQGVFVGLNTNDGIVKRIVGAALNRGVLQNGTGFCDASTFYKTEPVNEYAKLVHQLSVSGTNYAFSYDDVCSMYSSDIADGKPTSLTIDLQVWPDVC
jgi:hypothetical protein